MKAITIPRHGGRDVLTYTTDFPKPKPAKGEALVRIEVTGVNRVDLVVRGGYPGIVIPLPHIPGGDIVGVVEETNQVFGSELIGRRVVAYPLVACGNCPLCREGQPNLCLKWQYFGLHRPGGYAEYVTIPAACAVVVPDGIAPEAAVAAPVAGLTAFHALTTVGMLQPGQTFFIWGASGGLGTLAVQIARHLGATVIAAAGSAEKVKTLKTLGAHHVFNRHTDDIPAQVMKIAPAGVDLIIDYVGPATFAASHGLLKKGGRLLLCGILTGRETTISLHLTYLRHLSIQGLYLGTPTELKECLGWMADGRLVPHIHTVLPLKDASEAQRIMEDGEHTGKIVLKI